MKRHSSICRLDLWTCFSILLGLSVPAGAQIYAGWHDGMYLQLGDMVKLYRQQEPAGQLDQLIGSGHSVGDRIKDQVSDPQDD